jgi:formyltetrahydrofolate synthetase
VANGFPREAGFDITVASEVMAILCLARDLKDLEKRLGDIIVAYRRDKSPVYARDLKADGAMAVLLKDAIQPNLVQTLENNPAFVHGGPLYPGEMPLFEKVNTIVKRIYRGSEAIVDKSVRDQLKQWEDAGYGHLPVCMAKTQYSFSTDPNLRGAPVDHVVPVREVRLSAGAGFVVAICGEIMTMPGLPKNPSSEKILLNEKGQIEGLF